MLSIERNKSFYKTIFAMFMSQSTSTYAMGYCYSGGEIPWWLLLGKRHSDVPKITDG
jgi:hypothetical protein